MRLARFLAPPFPRAAARLNFQRARLRQVLSIFSRGTIYHRRDRIGALSPTPNLLGKPFAHRCARIALPVLAMLGGGAFRGFDTVTD